MANPSTTTSGTTTETATYEIDPAHSFVEFSVRHMMFSTAKGRFPKIGGEVVFDEADPTRSSVGATVDVASVSTGDPNRDGHLRSADFFDAENHPTLSFTSKRIEPTGREGTYRVIGDLTIRGVTHEVPFEATYLGKGVNPWGKTVAGFTATATITRKDWGLNWNAPLEAGGVLVSDQVKMNIDIQAVKK